MDKYGLFQNMIMELVWMSNGSSMGLSNDQAEQLKELWAKLNANGRSFFKTWASENDLSLPNYLSN